MLEKFTMDNNGSNNHHSVSRQKYIADTLEYYTEIEKPFVTNIEKCLMENVSFESKYELHFGNFSRKYNLKLTKNKDTILIAVKDHTQRELHYLNYIADTIELGLKRCSGIFSFPESSIENFPYESIYTIWFFYQYFFSERGDNIIKRNNTDYILEETFKIGKNSIEIYESDTSRKIGNFIFTYKCFNDSLNLNFYKGLWYFMVLNQLNSFDKISNYLEANKKLVKRFIEEHNLSSIENKRNTEEKFQKELQSFNFESN